MGTNLSLLLFLILILICFYYLFRLSECSQHYLSLKKMFNSNVANNIVLSSKIDELQKDNLINNIETFSGCGNGGNSICNVMLNSQNQENEEQCKNAQDCRTKIRRKSQCDENKAIEQVTDIFRKGLQTGKGLAKKALDSAQTCTKRKEYNIPKINTCMLQYQSCVGPNNGMGQSSCPVDQIDTDYVLGNDDCYSNSNQMNNNNDGNNGNNNNGNGNGNNGNNGNGQCNLGNQNQNSNQGQNQNSNQGQNQNSNQCSNQDYDDDDEDY